MGFFSEIRNECLIKELQRELNSDILLFGVDGFTYFGNLQAVEDCRIAILTPAIEAETTDVEILTPGGELRRVEFLRVDLWTVVGKGTGIVSDPIDPSGSASAAANGSGSGSGKGSGSGSGSGKGPVKGPGPRSAETLEVGDTERQESHCLIRALNRMIGDNVAITTLGGFLFAGILGDVKNELAILTVDDIFVPGTSSSISDDDVRSVVVNLEAVTSVSGTNTSVS